MKLWVLSDWHLETRLAWSPVRPEEFDILICAGDVDNDLVRAIEAVALLADAKPSVFVAGNHERAYSGWSRHAAAVQAAEDYGVHFLENTAREVGGALFAGATLWEQGHPRFQESVTALESFGADVIVTHFPPQSGLLFNALAAGCLWVHGHHHGYADINFAGRRVVRNAVGYANEPLDGDPAILDLVVET